jgi:hypothetical protein
MSEKLVKEERFDLSTALAMKSLGIKDRELQPVLYTKLLENNKREKLFSFLIQPKNYADLTYRGQVKKANLTLRQLLDPASIFKRERSYIESATESWIKYGNGLQTGEKHQFKLLSLLETNYLLASRARLALAVENLSKALPKLLTTLEDHQFESSEKAKAFRWTLKTNVNFMNEELLLTREILTKRTAKENKNNFRSSCYVQCHSRHFKRLVALKMTRDKLLSNSYIGKQFARQSQIPSLKYIQNREKLLLKGLEGVIKGNKKSQKYTTPKSKPKQENRYKQPRKRKRVKAEAKPERKKQFGSRRKKSGYTHLDSKTWKNMSPAEQEAYKKKQKEKN